MPPTTQSPPSWIRHGLASSAVVMILSVVSWWLLADPSWAVFDAYPLPFNGYLFWAIIFVVFAGFNLEFAQFASIRQPWRGLTITAATITFSVVATNVIAHGIGRFYPDFSADRTGGLGYFAAALFVLYAFGTYVLTVVNWGHWPWVQLGLKQPVIGWCEIAFWFFPTLALFLVFGLPAISETTTPGSALMSIDTTIGWFYCIIVGVVLTGTLLENRPWSRAGGPAAVAIASLIGNVVLGTLLYFVLVPFTKLLVGSTSATALGDVIHQYPAQLGVCWVFTMVLWANAFGNIGGLVQRVVTTFGLAVAVFALYFHVLAATLLHEPAVAPGATIEGNGLGFVNWLILMLLLYVVASDSWGLRRPASEEAAPAEQQPVGTRRA